MSQELPPGYWIRPIMKGKKFLIKLNGRAIGVLSSETEARRFAETDYNMRKNMDKSKLKVFEVPFTMSLSGTVKVLATDEKGAVEFLNTKVEDNSFGFDKDALGEEGLIHDGSMVFGDSFTVTEPENSGSDIKQLSDNPEEHPDWDAFDDESDDEQGEGE